MLYNQYESFTEVLPLVVLIPGGLAAYQLGRLVYRPNAAKVRRSARWMKVWLGVAVVADVLMVYLSNGMAKSGWIFAANRFAVALPPMLIAIVAALVFSLPRMRRLTKAARAVEDKTAPLTPVVRSLTTD